MDNTMNSMNGNKKNSICRYFASDGICFYGDECQFTHSRPHPRLISPLQTLQTLQTSQPLQPLQPLQALQQMSSMASMPQTIDSNNHLSHLPKESRLQTYLHQNNGNNYYNSSVDQSLVSQISQLSIDSQNGRRKLTPNSVNMNTHSSNSSSPVVQSQQQSQQTPQTVQQLNTNYFMTDSIKQELIRKLSLTQELASNEMFPDLPQVVDIYHELIPLESSTSSPSSTFNGFVSSVFRATNSKTGELYCLRRLHAFQPNTANAKLLINSIESWKKLENSNVVQLRQVFTTKAFSDNSVIFVYDYHPGSETLMSQYFASNSSSGSSAANNAMNGYSTSSRPYSQQQSQRKLLPESLLWNYIIQISSALRAIHSSGLSCRALDPTKIIMTSGVANTGAHSHSSHNTASPLWPRLRLTGCGVFDVLTHESFLNANNPKVLLQHFQQEDLLAFGKLCLVLASNSISSAAQRDNWQTSLELISRSYSADLRSLIFYLLSYKSNSGTTHTINDIMPMIGARFYTQLDSLYLREDSLIDDLSKEIDNGRVLRLLIKLGTINERPEFQLDPNWSETGDRYMLKLFRDYLFHQFTDEGRPWIDLGHIVSNLNKLDVGSQEKICLVSRDEQNILIVSFAELKRCFDSSLNELML